MITIISDSDKSQDLSPDEERRLRERAAQLSVDPLIGDPAADCFRPGTSDTTPEAFAPIREDFEASGMTEAELDALFETAIREVRSEARQESLLAPTPTAEGLLR
jgi:hypothetical protein